MGQQPVGGRAAGIGPVAGPDEAELRRMAERVVEVGALSEFILALRDGVRRLVEHAEQP